MWAEFLPPHCWLNHYWSLVHASQRCSPVECLSKRSAVVMTPHVFTKLAAAGLAWFGFDWSLWLWFRGDGSAEALWERQMSWVCIGDALPFGNNLDALWQECSSWCALIVVNSAQYSEPWGLFTPELSGPGKTDSGAVSCLVCEATPCWRDVALKFFQGSGLGTTSSLDTWPRWLLQIRGDVKPAAALTYLGRNQTLLSLSAKTTWFEATRLTWLFVGLLDILPVNPSKGGNAPSHQLMQRKWTVGVKK